MTRRILIAEVDGTGHRLNFVRLLLEQARDDHWTVLLPADAHVSPHIALHLADSLAGVRRQANPGWLNIESLSKEMRADLVVVPDGDRHLLSISKRLGWRGAGRLRVLLLRDPWMPLGKAGVKKRLVRSAKRVIVRVLNATPRLEILSLSPASRVSWRTPLRQIQDPIEFNPSAELMSKWGLDPDRFWFSVLGAVTHRKNLPIVAHALIRAAPDLHAGLLVAGPTEPDVEQTLDNLAPALKDAGVLLQRRHELLKDGDLDAAIAASDCVVLAHSNNGPSGLLGKAVVAGTRILASGAESLRHDCAAIGTGAVWVTLAEEPMADAMIRMPSTSGPQPREAAGASAFAAELLR